MKLANPNNPNSQNGMNVDVDFESLETMKCDECGNDKFINVYYLKKVSPLLTESGKAGLLPIPAFACSKCHHVNDYVDPFKKIQEKKLS